MPHCLNNCKLELSCFPHNISGILTPYHKMDEKHSLPFQISKESFNGHNYSIIDAKRNFYSKCGANSK